MLRLGIFLAGFASGWMARSTVDSSHELVVSLLAAAQTAYERIRRVAAMEREHIEDLFAEARARHEAKRSSADAAPPAPHAAVSRARAA